jgi:anthranilate phosphoribosyltransferase
VVGLTPEDQSASALEWPEVLRRLTERRDLSAAEAEATLSLVLSGAATPAQIGAFLTLLHAKGESIDEVTGLARAMVAAAVPLPLPFGDDEVVVDLVGTGGDRLRSINVTTLSALVVAGCGVPVCKHGNRAASSAVGTADVLEALGVAIEIGPAGVARCVAEAGMGFCFAQRFHPAMRYVGPVRKEVGVPTVFNFLGPLINPSRTRYQLVGVSDKTMAPIMANVFGATGSRRAMVMWADDGLDELSITSPSTVLDVVGDGAGHYEINEWRVDPVALGLPPATMDDLRGGDAEFNAKAIRSVLEGERSPRRDIALLNAAAGLTIAGRADGLEGGIVLANESIDSGRAYAVLEAMVATSQDALRQQTD